MKKKSRSHACVSRGHLIIYGLVKKVFHSVVFSILSVCAACAWGQNPAYQFTATGFSATADCATWMAVDGSNTLTSVHTATNGWSLAVKDGGTVFFDSGVSSPFGFPDAVTNTVVYALTVVNCSAPSNHATLIDAPCSIRFLPNPFGDSATFYESQLTSAVAFSINGTETNGLTATASPQLVEAAFDAPCALNDIYIGGAPATAAWAQSWSGGISELILLAQTPSEEELNAIRRYLSIQHGLAVPTESDAGIATLLVSMGIDTGGLFNSVFLVR